MKWDCLRSRFLTTRNYETNPILVEGAIGLEPIDGSLFTKGVAAPIMVHRAPTKLLLADNEATWSRRNPRSLADVPVEPMRGTLLSDGEREVASKPPRKGMTMRINDVILAAALLLGMLPASSSAEDAPEVREIQAQPSYVLSTKQVELAVTRLGGHMAPVTFHRDSDKPIQPYYVSPWQAESAKPMPAPVLVPLRGDFFCMPFGGNSDPVGGETHPPHGEVAGSQWTFVSSKKDADVATLTLAIDTKVRKGRVVKELSLVEGQNVVYSKDTITGFEGKAPLGHHATLAMPEKEGSVRIAVSPFRFGRTCPGVFSDPRKGEYQSLLPDTQWHDLTKVPAAWQGAPAADLTRLPSRFGHADLIQLVNEQESVTKSPAWTTATFTDEGYLWFSLKDPAVLRTTVFWIENHGRHGHPWNGRNNCLGLEDVTAFFAEGLAKSVSDNLLTAEGVPTAITLHADRPTSVNYIQGTAKIPKGFDIVREVKFAPGEVTFVSSSGERVTVPVRHEFLKTGKL